MGHTLVVGVGLRLELGGDQETVTLGQGLEGVEHPQAVGSHEASDRDAVGLVGLAEAGGRVDQAVAVLVGGTTVALDGEGDLDVDAAVTVGEGDRVRGEAALEGSVVRGVDVHGNAPFR